MSDPWYWILCIGLSALLILWIFLLGLFGERARAACSLVLRPNWLSVLGVPAALVGFFYFYRVENYFWAIILMSLSGGMDLADGRIGRAYVACGGKHLTYKVASWWTQMNHRGTTELGESLDPGADKIRLGLIFAYVCWDFFAKAEDVRYDGLLWLLYPAVILIILMLLADLGGQLIRTDYFVRWRPKKKRKDKKANLKGKAKALAQWLWLPAWAVWEKGLLPEAETYLAVLNILLIGVLWLTVLSLLSKMRPLAQLYKEGFPLKLD